MYKIKPVLNDEDIIKFEKMRYEAFKVSNKINNLSDCTYANAIKNMEYFAFFCADEQNNNIGGTLVGLKKNNLIIKYIFVDEKYRNKKAGSFILDYILSRKEMFENLFFEDINNVIAEPLVESTDFYYNNGFDSYRTIVYRKFKKNN